MGFACGPVTMAPGDTQEVAVAEMAAGATPGVDRLAAISLLRYQAGQVPDAVLGTRDMQRPLAFALRQNYPNPFNPKTTISYALASPSRVSLKVFNLVWQEVRTLVDGVEDAGGQAPFIDVRKMLVLR